MKFPERTRDADADADAGYQRVKAFVVQPTVRRGPLIRRVRVCVCMCVWSYMLRRYKRVRSCRYLVGAITEGSAAGLIDGRFEC